MKTIFIICIFALAFLIIFSSCSTMEEGEPDSITTTTTEETTLSHPLSSTVETQTTRSY